ncbi:hypothetical protein GGI22_005059 [Coemansia erecta]|nr:hypothetical protein GGI22_005059 [Coemansia erecta]
MMRTEWSSLALASSHERCSVSAPRPGQGRHARRRTIAACVWGRGTSDGFQAAGSAAPLAPEPTSTKMRPLSSAAASTYSGAPEEVARSAGRKSMAVTGSGKARTTGFDFAASSPTDALASAGHSLTVLSRDAVAKKRASGAHAASHTIRMCAFCWRATRR